MAFGIVPDRHRPGALDDFARACPELSPTDAKLVFCACSGYTSLAALALVLHRHRSSVREHLRAIYARAGITGDAGGKMLKLVLRYWARYDAVRTTVAIAPLELPSKRVVAQPHWSRRSA